MWKKDDEQTGQAPAGSTLRSEPQRGGASAGRATIGPSISIRGDVTGSEDLLIQGKIDGSVSLEKHSVSVGSEGRVNANITGRVITIEGHVEGDLTAQEQIVLRGSAKVQGDIKAPRVVLEDGATFRGLVDMGASSARGAEARSEKADKPAAGASAAKAENGASRTDDKAGASGTASTSGAAAAAASRGAGAADKGKSADRARA